MRHTKEITDSLFKDPDGVIYKHPDRTCQNCCKYPCMKNMDIFVSDFAKYGCTKYQDYACKVSGSKR